MATIHGSIRLRRVQFFRFEAQSQQAAETRALPLEQSIPGVFQLLHDLAHGPVQPVGHQLLLVERERRELLAEVTVNHVLCAAVAGQEIETFPKRGYRQQECKTRGSSSLPPQVSHLTTNPCNFRCPLRSSRSCSIVGSVDRDSAGSPWLAGSRTGRRYDLGRKAWASPVACTSPCA